ncbi:MAG: hypothetical protein K2P19_03465 [Kineothrix sp.]|nr:hypothetical protein [Kineothrix sp.]NBI90741.1 hypothetical protein [Lachnospiraceae bacterium]
MKKNNVKLLAVFLAGFIMISGCGASDAPEGEATETGENAEAAVEGNAGTNNEEAANAEEGNDGATPDEAGDNAGASEETDDSGNNTESPDDIPAPSTTPDSSTDIPAPATVPSTADVATPASVRPTAEELLAGERKSLVGIIIDATKYSVSIQAPSGECYYLTIPDTGVSGNLNYITIGQIATLTYVGVLDDTALLVGISDSSLITGIYVEEYAFAIKIINAVKAMDVIALADLTNFPVFLDNGTIHNAVNTRKEFEAIPSENIFSEALVERIVNYNLFDLTYTDAGFVLGGNGTPNITFDVDDEGILGIIGINSVDPATIDTEK